MSVCQNSVATKASAKPLPSWSPRCCGHVMHQLLRRMMVMKDGRVVFMSVWNCGSCGRVMQ